MSNGYPIELRKRVLDYLEKGGSKAEASRVFQLCRQTLYSWLALKEAGDYSLKPRPSRRKERKLSREALKEYLETHPDAYLSELAKEFKVTINAIDYALKQLKITRKKSRHST